MIFDTHAHYTATAFNSHREDLLSSLEGDGVCGVIDCGTDYITSTKSLELAHKYKYIYAAVGIHPESLIDEEASTRSVYKGDWQRELADIEALLQDERCVAVGECGLDYHWDIPKQAQTELFIAHIKLAIKYKMPILIHDREAHADMYEILSQYKPRGILHCFSGSAEDALRLVNDGMYIGFGGALTFKNARRAVNAALAVPLNRIVLETDCPYMAPEPLRGQENNSVYIKYVADKLADIKNIKAQEVLQVTEQNARDLFLSGERYV